MLGLILVLGLIGLAAWTVLAFGGAVIMGRGIRLADEREGHVRPSRVGQWWCAECRCWVRRGHAESPIPGGGSGSLGRWSATPGDAHDQVDDAEDDVDRSP